MLAGLEAKEALSRITGMDGLFAASGVLLAVGLFVLGHLWEAAHRHDLAAA